MDTKVTRIVEVPKIFDEPIQAFKERLREVLLHGGSLNVDSKSIWTLENFSNLQQVVNANLKEGKGNFLDKMSAQIQEARDTIPDISEEQQRALLPLIIELMSIYYVFPSNISRKTKKNALTTLIKGENSVAESLALSLENFPISRDAIAAGGIGSGGMGYNTNKQKEVFYLIDIFKTWCEKRSTISNTFFDEKESHLKFQNFLDEVSDGRSPQCRHALLHLMFPDYFEPIISSTQKWKIIRVFSDFYTDEAVKAEWADNEPTELTDQKLRVISKQLAELRKEATTNFYDKELSSFWDSSSAGVIPNLDTELLEYKKQVVLYGPPGTSKTFTATQLSDEIIRYRMAKDMGAAILQSPDKDKLQKAIDNNVHHLQLHPAYSYEDFIRGLQFQEGNTAYKPGYLLLLLEKMKAEPELPHVLILDEINRVDLSRLFGECFSALENRGVSIDLLGTNSDEVIQLNIPDNLYIIGTMNLIDHSVEQLDFALRRRFLWVEATYSAYALLEICKTKWKDLKWEGKGFTWEAVENDFEKLVDAANNLNNIICSEAELGEDFVLGHVFFLESVPFLHQFLQPYSRNPASFLYTDKGGWRDPIEKLWRLSLYPLLKEYLSGLDNKAQSQILKKLKEAFKP